MTVLSAIRFGLSWPFHIECFGNFTQISTICVIENERQNYLKKRRKRMRDKYMNKYDQFITPVNQPSETCKKHCFTLAQPSCPVTTLQLQQTVYLVQQYPIT